MGVFTISWWVVNQPIVLAIFMYASTDFRLDYPTLGGVEPLFYILLPILYPTIGGVTLYSIVDFSAFL